MNRTLALAAAAAFLFAAPISFAQTQEQPPQTPPPITQPAPPEQPGEPAPQAPAATPAPASPQSEPQGCRTRQPEGEQCACLSDTDRIGVSTPNSEGVNICVRPD